MGYQARRRHRVELLTLNARLLAGQRLDARIAEQPPRPVTVDELRAIAAESTDRLGDSADGDLPFTLDDTKVIAEVLLFGELMARVFVMESLAMFERINARCAAINAAMNETSHKGETSDGQPTGNAATQSGHTDAAPAQRSATADPSAGPLDSL